MSKCDNSKIIWKYYFDKIPQNEPIAIDLSHRIDDNQNSEGHKTQQRKGNKNGHHHYCNASRDSYPDDHDRTRGFQTTPIEGAKKMEAVTVALAAVLLWIALSH